MFDIGSCVKFHSYMLVNFKDFNPKGFRCGLLSSFFLGGKIPSGLVMGNQDETTFHEDTYTIGLQHHTD